MFCLYILAASVCHAPRVHELPVLCTIHEQPGDQHDIPQPHLSLQAATDLERSASQAERIQLQCRLPYRP